MNAGYVLIRNADGKYVAPPGREKSYTDRLEFARIFETKAEAEKERCVESERVESVVSLLNGKITDWTPAPSARCPFEYFHVYEEEKSTMNHDETIELLRQALIRCVKAMDALHPHDDVVRELNRAGLAQELSGAVNRAVGVLDQTAV